MEEYNHLFNLFKNTGHFKTVSNNLRYCSIPFTPEKVIGLAVHSLISHRPRDIYYANKEKIHFLKDKTQPTILSDKQKEDVIRENEMFNVLCYQPPIIQVYGLVDGRLRISYFDLCFTDRKFDIYQHFLDQTEQELEEKKISVELIKKDEQIRINKRIKRKEDHIKTLLDVMEKEESPLPRFAEKLEKKLKECGFQR